MMAHRVHQAAVRRRRGAEAKVEIDSFVPRDLRLQRKLATQELSSD